MSKRISLIFTKTITRKSLNESVRYYSRWMHRKPSKVVLPYEANPYLKKEKIINLDSDIIHANKNKNENIKNISPKNKKDDVNSVADNEVQFSPKKSKEIQQNRQEKLKKRKFYLSQEKVFDDNDNIIYEKVNENDGKISTLLVKLKNKKERLRERLTLVEGWRLIVDALEAKCKLNYLFFSNIEDLNNLRVFLPRTGVKVYKIPYKVIERWSDVETSPGILGVFETPSPDSVRVLSKPLPLHLICDNIRVPGNLGAILRAAVGSGCKNVLLTKGCVDLWEPKVIRSAAGAHFRLPIYNSLDWNEIPKHVDENTSVFIADSNAKVDEESSNEIMTQGEQLPVLPYYGVDYSTLSNITVIVGGETEGISEQSYTFAASRNGLRLNIPMQKGVDSLNTGMATAVIAFEIRKQLIQYWQKIRLERQTSANWN